MSLGRSLLITALLLSAGCTAGDKASTEQQAKAIADAYLRKTFPNGSVDKIPADALDMQDRWRFCYSEFDHRPHPPSCSIIVVVNKRRGEVVHMESQQ